MDNLQGQESPVNTNGHRTGVRTGFVRDRFTWERQVGESTLPPMARLVAYVIAQHFNTYDEVVWPSITRISKLAGCDRRTVQRNLGLLVEHGFLSIRNRGGHSNVYTLTGWHDAAPTSEQPAAERRPRVRHSAAQNKPVEQTKKNTSPHGEIFKTLCTWMGRSPGLGERGRWGKVAKEMVADGVEPDQVLRRGKNLEGTRLTKDPGVLWSMWSAMDNPNGSASTIDTAGMNDRLREWAERTGRGELT